MADIAGMKEAGAVALSEDGKSVMDSLVFRHALKEAAKNKIPMFSHCEDKALVDGEIMNAGAKAEELGAAGNYERSRRRYRCQRYSDGKRDRLPVTFVSLFNSGQRFTH